MSNLTSHNPITMWETISGNTEFTQNPLQAAGQTNTLLTLGAPVQLNASGYAKVWDGTTIAAGIYGVSLQPGDNLGTAGAGAPPNFGQIGPPWANISIGAPPNQPNAVTIPYGAPLVTGGLLTMVANDDTIFKAQTDTSEGTTTITAAALATTGIVSVTATNVHYVGEQVVFAGFTGAGIPLNGLIGTVLTASGSAYTAQTTLTGTVIATAGTGTDTPGAVTPTIASVGKQYGLTIDSSGTWYIDFNKTTPGTNTVLVCTGLYQADILQNSTTTEVPNGQLLFQFLPAAMQV
jgi:hypothetical protein